MEDHMLKPRWLFAFLMIGIGALQAWDSHVLQAERSVQAIVATGIVTPAAAFFLSSTTRIRIVALLIAAASMIVARFVSEVGLPDLMLAAFFPAVVIWFDSISARRGDDSRLIEQVTGSTGVSKAAFPLSFDDFVMLGMAVGNLPFPVRPPFQRPVKLTPGTRLGRQRLWGAAFRPRRARRGLKAPPYNSRADQSIELRF
jgi:hypothetical protein